MGRWIDKIGNHKPFLGPVAGVYFRYINIDTRESETVTG